MKRFYINATMRADAIGHHALLGLLDGSPESDHRLAWSLFRDTPDSSRRFVFRVARRAPYQVRLISPSRPSPMPGVWDLDVQERDLVLPDGRVVDIDTRAVLLKSEKAPGSGNRGKKHDLVSCMLHGLRAGRPAPEVAHLPTDANRREIAQVAALAWTWRKAPSLGFELVHGPGQEPLFHAEPASRGQQGLHTEKTHFRALCIRARVKVTDPRSFAETLAHGIGSGRGFGYGLVDIRM